LSYFKTSEVKADSIDIETLSFVRKTYLHVVFTLIMMVLLEYLLITSGIASSIFKSMENHLFIWFTLLLFILIGSWVVDRFIDSIKSKEMQYLILSAYIICLSLCLLPSLYKMSIHHPQFLRHSLFIISALIIFISYFAFSSKYTFSLIKIYFVYAAYILIIFAISGMLFKFNFGLYYSWIAVVIFGGFIFFNASDVIHDHDGYNDEYVLATIHLFASIPLLLIEFTGSLFRIAKDH